jgi:hypothetical protein
MISTKTGKITSATVENITPIGIWLYVQGREYFLDYKNFPFFEDESVKKIHNVVFSHGIHLYWPDLDVDLELDNLEHPEKYPLTAKRLSRKSK